MKRNYFIIGLCIALAICLAFLLWPDAPIDSHKTSNDIVQADNKIIIEQRNAGLKKIDSLEKGIVKRDSLIAKQATEISAYRRDLDKSTAKAVQLAKEIKVLKQSDTTELGRKADSLATEVINFAWLYEQYKLSSDSLSVLVDKNNEDYINAMNEQRRLYDELYVKYEQLYKLYNALYKGHQQAGKKLRREKLKTKVAALLGAAGAVILLLK
jgi:hypothetical protein